MPKYTSPTKVESKALIYGELWSTLCSEVADFIKGISNILFG